MAQPRNIPPHSGRDLPPLSRRERPAKAALTRKGIIEAALQILDEEGLGKVTTRRIAATLDTGAASLYVYVRNTEDLYAQILDALLGRMAPVPTNGSWRDRIHALLAGYAEVLVTYPEVARMTVASHPVGPNYSALVESILELLHDGGVPDSAAAWGIDVLFSAVTADAVEHGGGGPSDGEDTMSVLSNWIATAPAEIYPRIVSLGDDMLSGAPDERFNWGIDVLINGMLNTPRS
jgi:AcrR family transcriptional regulator